jgi:hypothetical protein
VLIVLGRLAEFERESIRGCTGEGRERAKAAQSSQITRSRGDQAPRPWREDACGWTNSRLA